MAGNGKAAEARRLLWKGEFILAPGIYDGISARVADGMGFPALYMTGYGATASMLGLPDAGLATYSDMVGRAEMICSVIDTPLIADADAGLATYSDMVGRAEMICSVIDTPLIADADTGYGGVPKVHSTGGGYQGAGGGG